MPLPASVSTIEVTQQYLSVDGAPASGTVTLDIPANLALKVLDVDTWLVPQSVVGVLDAQGWLKAQDGVSPLVLMISDDPDVTPPFAYRVTERLSTLQRTYQIELPSTLLPGPVALSDVAVTGATPSGTTALTRAVADTLYAAVGSTGGGGVASWTEIESLPDYPVALPTDVDHIAGLAVHVVALLGAASTALARQAIGAGTSSLVLGSTAGTAKAGDWSPSRSEISDASALGRDLLAAASQQAARVLLDVPAAGAVVPRTWGVLPRIRATSPTVVPDRATWVAVNAAGYAGPVIWDLTDYLDHPGVPQAQLLAGDVVEDRIS